MSNIKILRESVCAADDQTNRLELTIKASRSTTLEALMSQVLSRNFLQFSSSHSVMTAYSGGDPIAKVHAKFKSAPKVEFLIDPDSLVDSCLSNGSLEFMWAGSNNSFKPRPLRGSA